MDKHRKQGGDIFEQFLWVIRYQACRSDERINLLRSELLHDRRTDRISVDTSTYIGEEARVVGVATTDGYMQLIITDCCWLDLVFYR